MAEAIQRVDILKKVQTGEITIDDGLRLLKELEGEGSSEPEATELPASADGFSQPVDDFPRSAEPEPEERPHVSGFWKALWTVPTLLGVVISVLGAWWIYKGWTTGGPGWAFWLAWLPFLLGLGITYLGAQFVTAPWMHLRVEERKHKEDEDGKNNGQPEVVEKHTIVISIPMPFRMVGWFLRTFDRHLPENVRGKRIDLLMNDLENAINHDEPMVIHVDEEDGDKVDIYFG
jgi:hypothetical protein